MRLILLVIGGVLLGYAIPVLTSLIFTLAVGRIAPRALAKDGRLEPGFLILHGLVWTLASAVAGYGVSLMLPQFRVAACTGAALILIVALILNAGEMKKKQGAWRLGGMVLGTAAGFAGGLVVFLAVGCGRFAALAAYFEGGLALFDTPFFAVRLQRMRHMAIAVMTKARLIAGPSLSVGAVRSGDRP